MKKGESRFFLNWQMSCEVSAAMHQAKSEHSRRSICSQWLQQLNVFEWTSHLNHCNTSAKDTITQFTNQNCEFAHKAKFTEKKLACFMEIMIYCLRILIE